MEYLPAQTSSEVGVEATDLQELEAEVEATGLQEWGVGVEAMDLQA